MELGGILAFLEAQWVPRGGSHNASERNAKIPLSILAASIQLHIPEWLQHGRRSVHDGTESRQGSGRGSCLVALHTWGPSLLV